MSPLARVYHLPVRRRTRTAITVAQFNELMAAIDALPDRIADELERQCPTAHRSGRLPAA